MPYQRSETQNELHYPNNTFLFSPFGNIGSNIQRKLHSGSNLIGEPFPIEREVFALSLKSGGLGIDCPENHHDDYELAKKLSEPLEDKDPLIAELWQKRTLDDLIYAKKKKIAKKTSNTKKVS